MGCPLYKNCGGCVNRQSDEKAYQQKKETEVRVLLEQNLGSLDGIWAKPIFLPDGTRRRAAFAFQVVKGKPILGFNENKSHVLEDIQTCAMLTPKINEALADLRELLIKLCSIKTNSLKKKKTVLQLSKGDLLVLEAENGLDVVLEADIDLGLQHRFEIADFMTSHDLFVRFSFRKKHNMNAEPIVEKAKPFIKVENTKVLIASGDFLQASKEGQDALIELVKKYVGDTSGKAADLFCGIGTFSYALADMKKMSVVAVDVSKSLLENFEHSIRAQMIQNIQIKEQNLFLYPMTADELKGFNVIVFDPPRAGAKEQVEEFCKIDVYARPEKIIAVSCNPITFARDAKILINGGYCLKNITMVDQFVYSNHSELVGLFTNEK